MPASEARRTSRCSSPGLHRALPQATQSSMVGPAAAHGTFSRLFVPGARDASNCNWLLGESEPYSQHVLGITLQQSLARMRCQGLTLGPVMLCWPALAAFSIRQSCKATLMAALIAQIASSSSHVLLVLLRLANSEQKSCRTAGEVPWPRSTRHTQGRVDARHSRFIGAGSPPVSSP